MPDLVALGAEPEHRWQRTLPDGPVTLGRTAGKCTWDVPWDRQISGLHATLTWQDGRLTVQRHPAARNQVFFRGQALDDFTLAVGEQFVIGQTTFMVQETPAARPKELPTPHSELTISRQELRQVKFTNAEDRIEVLAALPAMIRTSPSEQELENRVVDVLLRGIPRAEAAAVVRLLPDSADSSPAVQVGAVKAPSLQDDFQPSRRLVYDAIHRRRQSVLYSWGARGCGSEFTVMSLFDWAMCVPLPDDPFPGWGLYVTGRLLDGANGGGNLAAHDHLKSDLKFAELVADVLGALRHVRDLQQRHGLLARFLSRTVLAVLADHADLNEVLRPREAEVTVLFCDLRGSSRLVEEGRHELSGIWDRVSEALSIMTSSITDQDGVIGDFQGDAAMGFWGWPLYEEDQVERAARAALTIRRRFAHAALEEGNPLAGFTCGIGLATGPAIAGRLGTEDQFKVGVFGPVVNLASRLEGMTKFFQAQVLADERTAQALTRGGHSYWVRSRRLAKVRPYGMDTVLTVSELLPPVVEPGALRERDRRDYEAALDAFLAGRWQDAAGLLHRLPDDGAAQFLLSFMDLHPAGPPAGWDGVIPLEGK